MNLTQVIKDALHNNNFCPVNQHHFEIRHKPHLEFRCYRCFYSMIITPDVKAEIDRHFTLTP